MIYISLNSYLAELKEIQSENRVPTITALAKSIGMHQTSLARWSSGKIKHINANTLDAIIKEMRKRGFDTDVSDIIKFRD